MSPQAYLDGDRVPFDMRVFETSLGLYEIQVLRPACGRTGEDSGAPGGGSPGTAAGERHCIAAAKSRRTRARAAAMHAADARPRRGIDAAHDRCGEGYGLARAGRRGW